MSPARGILALSLGGAALLVLARGARSHLDWPDPPPWGPASGPTAEASTFGDLHGSPPATARLRVLAHNTDAWLARWTLLAGARRRIDVACFIVDGDTFGHAFLGHLLRRAEAGVRVRLLLDAQGLAVSQLPDRRGCLSALAATPGAEVRVYRPLVRRGVAGLATLSPVVALASNHDKLMVADGRLSLVGGRNVASVYFADPQDLASAFDDLDVLATGEPTAAALTQAFDALFEADVAQPIAAETAAPCRAKLLAAYEAMDAWLRAGGRVPVDHPLRRFGGLRGALDTVDWADGIVAEARVLDSVPRMGAEDAIGHALERLITGANRDVLLVSPYLVLTDEFVEVLAAAGRRGVRTTVLTNSPVSSDNPLSQQLFREQWPRLVAHVPHLRVVASGERTLHAKLAVADAELVLVGSFNLDPLSLSMNGETALAVRSRAVARRIARRARERIAAGPPETYEYAIARDAAGEPLYDGWGRPIIAFGAADHSDSARWRRPNLAWRILGVAAQLPILPPVF